jgi:hypothetical protein
MFTSRPRPSKSRFCVRRLIAGQHSWQPTVSAAPLVVQRGSAPLMGPSHSANTPQQISLVNPRAPVAVDSTGVVFTDDLSNNTLRARELPLQRR